MAELNYKIISGILTLILLVGGTTYYIQSIEEKTGCKAGWQYEISGDNAGQYGCTTATGTRYETCFNVYNSANTENYWCKKGVKVLINKEEIAVQERLTFKDFPELTGQANITRIWKRLNDEVIVIEWEIVVFNKRDNVSEKLSRGFEISKEQKDNISFIQDTLASEIKRQFEDYNKTFIPNPIIEYKDHPLWR